MKDTDPKVEFLLQGQESLYVVIYLQDDEYYKIWNNFCK